ncbi:histidine phosphatase family protein [Actinomadura syzygii]|uniref:Histidine phosphatase family protein n=1 Tax=Actinomadura syzygii TaxID=1427538 RepID=A0A5D0U5W2_9ACTN|nr:histidine phosphatase family protein [Actinomadura syzygii]TYC13056.1 histidine phosphatase family protein [Actinomadura syzygii]
MRPRGPSGAGPGARLTGVPSVGNAVLFVRQATSAGMREARFPAGEPADASGLARARALAGTLPDGPAWTSPARAARETAAALGLAGARPAAELAEADHGRWAGRRYADVAAEEPDELARWLVDPWAVPHGGETRAALAGRVTGWLAADPRGVVVCDAGVIRAAVALVLGIDVTAGDRFDVAPLSTTCLSAAGSGWRVAHVNRKVSA